MNAPLRIGMISFAHAGHPGRYFDALMDDARVKVVGIWDDQPARVTAHAPTAQVPFVEDRAELLTSCDAVVVCSEYSRHREHVVEALEAGVHVLCAKPLAHNLADTVAIRDAAHASDRVFMVSLPCRSLAPVVEARRLVQAGTIGEVVSINGTNRGACPGEWFVDASISGGGAIMDHTAHMADLIRWITGAEIATVHAFAGHNLLSMDVEDAGLLQLTLSNGVIVAIDTSWSRLAPLPNPLDITMRILGTRGSILVDVLAQRIDVHADGIEWNTFGGNMDREMIADFVSAAIAGDRPPITVDDGYEATLPSFAAYDALRTGSPVRVAGRQPA